VCGCIPRTAAAAAAAAAAASPHATAGEAGSRRGGGWQSEARTSKDCRTIAKYEQVSFCVCVCACVCVCFVAWQPPSAVGVREDSIPLPS